MPAALRHPLRVAAVLAVAAGLNVFPVVTPGPATLLLGPFVYLPLVMVLPLPWAVAAAGIPLAVTQFSLGHPFLLVSGLGEALWLAWVLRRTDRSAVLADVLYWAGFGAPVLFACYGEIDRWPLVIVAAIAGTHVVNHLAAVAIASLLVRHSRFGEWILGRPLPQPQLRELLVHSVLVLAVVPLAIAGAGVHVTLGGYLQDQNRTVLTETARRVSQQIELFLEHHQAVLESIARTLGRDGANPAVLLEENKRAHDEFITMLVTDAEGRIAQAAPASALPVVRGSSVADREYFRRARDERRAFVSGVFRGRGFGRDIIVAISAPIIDAEGRFLGIVQAALEVQTFAQSIAGPRDARSPELLIADRTGRIIHANTQTPVPPLARLGLLPEAAALDAPPGRRIEFEKFAGDGGPVPYVAYVERTPSGHAIVVAQRPAFAGLPDMTWIVWVFAAVAALLLGAAAWVTRNVRRQVTVPLEAFARDATRQANVGSVERISNATSAAPFEVAMVYQAFNQLAGQLQLTYDKLREHNVELDRRVAERTRELEIAREQAVAANRSKSDFLAMTSHEIRTPLNAIIGLAEALEQSCGDPAAAKQLHTIRQAGVRLLNVVNDVLDLSRAEAGKLEVKAEPVELGELVREVEQLFQLRAANQGLGFTVDIQGALPLWFAGDALRLQQVLINLVGNALKFTTQGGITLRATALPAGDGLALRFAVIDTGPGIAPEHQARLFEPYVQLPEAGSAQPPGTGLGLAISRRLVRLLGGELALRSELGRGAEFWFTLHVAPASAPAAAPEAPPPPSPGIRVLAADDNVANQEVVRLLLEPHCSRLEIVSSADEALALLRTATFDLALIDLHMPGRDGYSVARAARAENLCASGCVLVATSAHSRLDVWPECAASGFDAFVGKPVERRELLEVVNGARRHRAP